MKKQVESFNNSFLNKENSIKDSTNKIEEISSSGSESEMGKISSADKTLSLFMFNGKNKYKIYNKITQFYSNYINPLVSTLLFYYSYLLKYNY